MANVIIGAKGEQTKNSTGILQAEVGVNTYQYKGLQNMEWGLDDASFERVFIDDQTPVFANVGDKIGSFFFDLLKSVDMAEPTPTPPGDMWLASYWLDQLKRETPAEIAFVETMQGPNSGGSKFWRARFTGRVMDVKPIRSEETQFSKIEVRGEVIALTSLLREAA